MPDPTAPSKPTLEFALRRHAVPRGVVIERNPDVVPLVARILGVVPRVFSYLEIWPPAFETYALVVPAFFELPFCDLGIGIGSKTRSLVAYASSRGHGCAYCSAHTAALGNVFSGAEENLEQNARALSDGVCQLPAPRDRAIVDYGVAVGRGGEFTCSSEVARLHEHFSARDVERIVLVAATMGLLNRCLDTLGMVLEGPLLEMARTHLAPTGWDESAVFDAATDQQLIDQETAPPPTLGPLGLVRAMAGAARFQGSRLKKYSGNIEDHAREALGFCPDYLLRLHSGTAKKTILHLLIDRMVRRDFPLDTALRCAIAARFCQANHDQGLAEDFERMAVHAVGRESIERLLASDFASSELLDVESICLAAAQEVAPAPVRLSPQTVARLRDHLSPEQIVEFVLTVSIASCLSRIARSLSADSKSS